MYRRYYYEESRRNGSSCCAYCVIALSIMGFIGLSFAIVFNNNLSKIAIDVQKLTEEQEAELAFESFKLEYGKNYEGIDEENTRRAIFKSNYEMINAINAEGNSFTLGINKFADLTQEEFRRLYLTSPEPVDISLLPTLSDDEIDEDIDWVKLGALNNVRDQGNCGSCWTFASIAAAEAINFIEYKEMKQFSEQELIDCCKTKLSDGCNGGERYEALKWIADNGISNRRDYPYKASNNKCTAKGLPHSKPLSGYKNITERNGIALARELILHPVTIGVNASPVSFMFYKEGILSKGCPANEINHAVLAVGVGSENGTNFWKIRNSWGVGWGDKGYIRILREKDAWPGLCAVVAKVCAPVEQK